MRTAFYTMYNLCCIMSLIQNRVMFHQYEPHINLLKNLCVCVCVCVHACACAHSYVRERGALEFAVIFMFSRVQTGQ